MIRCGKKASLTSVLEKISLSMKSATPSSRTLVSANATPTALWLDFTPVAETGTFANWIAITTGAERISELTNSKSSTAWRFPGEAWSWLAYVRYALQTSLTSLSNLNIVPFFPCPLSDSYISTRSCFDVKASLRSICATETFSVTLSSLRAPAPRYLITDLVWKTCCATKTASGPYAQ